MKNNLFKLSLIMFILSSCKEQNCERFFTYEERTVEISGLKNKLNQMTDTLNLEVGSFRHAKVPVEVSDRLKELDLMQYVFCSKIEELPEDDPERRDLQKRIIGVYMEFLRVAYIEGGIDRNKPKLDFEKLPEQEFQRLRGRRDGYAAGFIVGSLGRYYKNNNSFPATLNSLNVEDKIAVLGNDNITYQLDPDKGFIFRFAGGDGRLNTPDDRIYTKNDITDV